MAKKVQTPPSLRVHLLPTLQLANRTQPTRVQPNQALEALRGPRVVHPRQVRRLASVQVHHRIHLLPRPQKAKNLVLRSPTQARKALHLRSLLVASMMRMCAQMSVKEKKNVMPAIVNDATRPPGHVITSENLSRLVAGRALPRPLSHPQRARTVQMIQAGLNHLNRILVPTISMTRAPVLIQVFHEQISQLYPHPRAV